MKTVRGANVEDSKNKNIELEDEENGAECVGIEMKILYFIITCRRKSERSDFW